jgi:hypothetical protein
MPERVARRLLILTLILAVSALGVHALVHGFDASDNGQHCQVCHISRAGMALPVSLASLDAPVAHGLQFIAPAKTLDALVVCNLSSTRGPPA